MHYADGESREKERKKQKNGKIIRFCWRENKTKQIESHKKKRSEQLFLKRKEEEQWTTSILPLIAIFL